ncbi:MAG: hypothetical protein QXR62_00020 [Candidatus Bathyarchaeia archaeon]|nr:hypothetical protein [Candidatus Bathyarchaeota archaeon]
MSITPELYDFIVKVVEDKVRDIRVTREEFDRLRKDMDEHFRRLEDAVAGLTEAQRRTEEGLKSLAEAQKRTEEELKALAETQRRTEERLNALAEAQKRTEDELKALAEAQRMTEARLSALAEAQKRTEEAIMKLIISLDALRVEVGRLSETVGFGLEDIARVVLPGWVYARLGIRVSDLRREFIKVDGREVEVNLYGEGELKGEKIIIVGEVKSRIYGSDVKEFYDNIYVPIARMAEAKVIGILFGYLIHPSAKKLSEELGLHVVVSYE